MAGKSVVLQAGQILFRKDEPSDGMYLVRKGQLEVYLEQQGRQVVLAQVQEGGMIGEMALFDQKPRSAAVKALVPTEVTHISNDDFAKLMKQIPKWFTALMVTLSGRLRSTNARLEELQAKCGSPLQAMHACLRLLSVLDLIWHRDGIKENKDWVLEKAPCIQTLATIFAEKPKVIEANLAALVAQELISERKNAYKTDVLVLANRGVLKKFIDFFAAFATATGQACLPLAAIDLLKTTLLYAEKGAYESVTLAFSELENIGRKNKIATLSEWKAQLGLLSKCHSDAIQLVKTSTGEIGIKTSKKLLQPIVQQHALLYALHKQVA